MTEELEFFINEITYVKYGPYEDARSRFQNESKVEYWEFRGDGACDYEERSQDAQPEIVLDYIRRCESQIKLAKKYLREVRDL